MDLVLLAGAIRSGLFNWRGGVVRHVACIAFAAFALSQTVTAQVAATNTSKLGWTQAAPTLAIANGYRYDVVVDALPFVSLTGVVCTGSSPFACTGNFPAATPGTHTLTLATTDASVTPALSSVPTAPLSFRLVVAPAMPVGLTVIP